MSNEARIPMTKEGYERLKADLDRMSNVEAVEVAKRIAAARELGDLRENAEYHAAREDAGMLQARIDALRDKLSRADIVEASSVDTGTVGLGAKVRVFELTQKEEEIFQFVSPGEDDYNDNKFLLSSPTGQAMAGKKVGDVCEVKAPIGLLQYEIKEITYSV
ncbi:MAG TPA: transcription elongation factor GreA [Gemmatales bacterium]|nr:transcription elongation factor GreA [Gemmatales bacterium]